MDRVVHPYDLDNYDKTDRFLARLGMTRKTRVGMTVFFVIQSASEGSFFCLPKRMDRVVHPYNLDNYDKINRFLARVGMIRKTRLGITKNADWERQEKKEPIGSLGFL